MKSFLIAANWKMNGDPLFISDFMRDFSASYHRSPQQEIIFLPPFVYLRDVYAQISSLPQIYLGAQNVSEFAAGAYTGEISPAMLKSVSCQYVLVGHSERRTLFHETNQIAFQIKN